MITPAMSRRAEELTAEGASFVTATVVRAQRPTSVQAGNVALVLADGTIEGFVGGVCSEHSVRAYALRGDSQTARPCCCASCRSATTTRPPPTTSTARSPSRTRASPAGRSRCSWSRCCPRRACSWSGETPVAGAVLRIGGELGLTVLGVDGAEVEPRAGDLALVVAAHGRDELHTLRRGLEAGVPYVGLVASPKRGTGVLAELRSDGVPEELVARIDVPAGIDIGARTPAEIALSILARIVAVRRDGQTPAAEPTQPSGAGRRGRRAAARGRPDLRDDGGGGREHALGRPRRRDRLLLLRGLQGDVRGARTRMPASRADA